MNINNIKTNNFPLVDSLIYNLKKLTLSAVIKDETLADKYENIETSRNASIYIACIEGYARLDMFDITRKLLLEITDYPDNIIDMAVDNVSKLSNELQYSLLSILITHYINNYEEKNNYYRMLNGLPDIGEEGIYIHPDLIPSDIILSTDKYIHEMERVELDLLYTLGIMDSIILLYPTKKYLNYLGGRSINFYDARKADNFSLLYVSDDVPEVIYTRFRSKFELNKVFTLKTVYSSAFKYGSDYYDGFIRVFILVQTIVDILSEMTDIIIKKDIFDIRMIQLMFEANGVDFFPEIPIKYQLSMIRNLNRLIEFKSTTKNIIDICSLFGFDNIKVFKYYLLKERKIDDNTGKYLNYTKSIEDPTDNTKIIDVEDTSKNYDLKFIRVPIDDIIDNHLYDYTAINSYDDVICDDKYWNGDRTYDEVKQDILDREFNYLQSKYISVETIYDMTEMSFELTYFFNMLFDNVELEDKLLLSIPCISGSTSTFKFVDVMCYLLALSYIYNGVEDDLMDTQSKILYIKGFNFDADIQTLANYVSSKGYTLEDLGISDFKSPTSNVLSYNEILNIFTKNKEIYNHVVYEMTHADNKKIYDVYKKIYDSLLIDQLTTDFFKLPNGTTAKTYTEFLRFRNPILYNSLIAIKNIKDGTDKIQQISEMINNIVYIIDQELDLDGKYQFIFSHLASVSADAVKKYIYKVINFFKSYKVDILNINTIYMIDDRLENQIKMIDEAIINHELNKSDTVHYNMKSNRFTSLLNKNDSMSYIDKLYIDITYWINHYFMENPNIIDNKDILINLLYKSRIHVYDTINISSIRQYQETINKLDDITITRIYS